MRTTLVFFLREVDKASADIDEGRGITLCRFPFKAQAGHHYQVTKALGDQSVASRHGRRRYHRDADIYLLDIGEETRAQSVLGNCG